MVLTICGSGHSVEGPGLGEQQQDLPLCPEHWASVQGWAGASSQVRAGEDLCRKSQGLKERAESGSLPSTVGRGLTDADLLEDILAGSTENGGGQGRWGSSAGTSVS